MQAEADVVPVERRADLPDPRLIERAELVGLAVEADVGVADAVRRRPIERLLEAEPAAEIDPDPLAQPHPGTSPSCEPAVAGSALPSEP